MTQLVRHRFTADEFHRMAAAGVFGDDDRVELIGFAPRLIRSPWLSWEPFTTLPVQ